MVISAYKVFGYFEPVRNRKFLSYSETFLQCYAQNIVSGQKGNITYIPYTYYIIIPGQITTEKK